MNEDICLTCSCSSDGQLSMSAVHGVSGLESDNPGPAKFVEVKAEFCWGI